MKLGGQKAHVLKQDFSAEKAPLKRREIAPVPVQRIVTSMTPKWPSFGEEAIPLRLIKKSAVAAIKTMNVMEYEKAVHHFFESLYELEEARVKGIILIAFRIAKVSASETVIRIDKLKGSISGMANVCLVLSISEETKQCSFMLFKGDQIHSEVGPAIVKFGWEEKRLKVTFAIDGKTMKKAEWQRRFESFRRTK